jgi:hypothetical protein
MRGLILFALANIAVFALMACGSADSVNRAVSISTPSPTAKPAVTPATRPPSDGVRRITTVELQELLNRGEAFVVDVRNQASYDLGHVRGAKLIPNTEVGLRSNELPRDKTIVTYCS